MNAHEFFGKIKEPVKGHVTRIHTDLESIILGLSENLIYPYKYNRGTVGANSPRVIEMVENFYLPALGDVMVALDPNGNLMQVDAHHRACALEILYNRGLLSKEQLKSEITIRVVRWDERLTAYRRLNKSKGHTTKEIFTNEEQWAGDILKTCYDTSGLSEKFPSNVEQNILEVGHVFTKGIEFNKKNLTSAKTKIRDLKDIPANEVSERVFSKKALSIMADSMSVLNRFNKVFQLGLKNIDNKAKKKKLKAIQNSSGLATTITILLFEGLKPSKINVIQLSKKFNQNWATAATACERLGSRKDEAQYIGSMVVLKKLITGCTK